MQIRPALPTDAPGIWEIIRPVIRAGDTYALDPCLTETEAIALWLSPDRETFVAEDNGVLVGTYYMRSNYYRRPSYLRPDDVAAGHYNRHVCNCGFISAAPDVGRAMAEHALREARGQGYRAMQFNLVATPARSGCGTRWGLKLSPPCPAHSCTPPRAMWTRS